MRIVSTPSRHYSGRGITDRNATLWGSWAVIGSRHRFYVSGDTGYSDHFHEIGERVGPFDMAFVKIGAYGPGAPWLDIHMAPEDAVRAHRDVRAQAAVPGALGHLQPGVPRLGRADRARIGGGRGEPGRPA